MKNKSNLLSALNAANARCKTVKDLDELRAVLRDYEKKVAAASHDLYGIEVAARKAERTERKAKRDAAAQEARDLRAKAKEAAAAAAALVQKKPRKAKKNDQAELDFGGSPAKPRAELIKKAKRSGEELTATEVVDSAIGALADIADND